jgi:hypothetical protein
MNFFFTKLIKIGFVKNLSHLTTNIIVWLMLSILNLVLGVMQLSVYNLTREAAVLKV